ncbi:MAG: hypothetical protein P8I93_02535 [Crocinitomicaceae bacterium]|nr:hypothetical protein [Crocinitomicaceae bacterium]
MRLLFVFVFLLGLLSCGEEKSSSSSSLNVSSINSESKKEDTKTLKKVFLEPVLVNDSNSNNQEKNSLNLKPKYKFPNELNNLKKETISILEKTYKDEGQEIEYGYHGYHNMLNYNHESFHPIGWSKTGVFAFLNTGVGDGCGCPYIRIKIINPNNNKAIWEHMIIDGDDDLEQLWSENYKIINEKLSKFDIEQDSIFEFSKSLSIPKNSLKLHRIEEEVEEEATSYELQEKGSVGIIKNPFKKAMAVINYYYWGNEARGESTIEYDVYLIKKRQ